jgi:hypothetical protein
MDRIRQTFTHNSNSEYCAGRDAASPEHPIPVAREATFRNFFVTHGKSDRRDGFGLHQGIQMLHAPEEHGLIGQVVLFLRGIPQIEQDDRIVMATG